MSVELLESDTETVKDCEENVRVVVRVRPLHKKELSANCVNIVTVDTLNRSVSVQKPSNNHDEPPKMYTFDYVFPESATQMEVYSETTRPIVDSVMEGYNGTILAYGQTGTGKTYTMSGYSTPETCGIIPNTFAQIFGHIAKADPIYKFLVCVTYIEIYNEEIKDLITNTGNLEIREQKKIGVFVNGLTGYICRNADEIHNILELGAQNRKVGQTAMNEESSRSHAILNITVESSIKSPGAETRFIQGKLSLVDLAGSERQQKTQAEGVRLKESAKINLSLSVLGNVISALVDGKSTHIPYRNSKLTRLLQDSLGGNSKTVMIATIGPADMNYEETISTLRYANRAKNIQNHTRPNKVPHETLIKAFEKQINELRRQLEEEPCPILVEEEVVEEEEEEREMSRSTTLFASDISTDSIDLKNNEKVQELNVKKSTHIDEITKTKIEQAQLQEKLSKLEEKILVGGENMLEKAVEQERMLEEINKEIEQRRQNELTMMETIKNIELKRADMEGRYNNLSEEVLTKTRRLNKLANIVTLTRAELNDMMQDHQREMEGLLESLRIVTKDLQLLDLLVNEHVPLEYYKKIESFAQWNEDIGEWLLKCVAYTGNHMRKQENDKDARKYRAPPITHLNVEFPAYLNYPSQRTITVQQKSRRTSGVPRPKTYVRRAAAQANSGSETYRIA